MQRTYQKNDGQSHRRHIKDGLTSQVVDRRKVADEMIRHAKKSNGEVLQRMDELFNGA
jgi:hypothetical protein